MARRFEFSYSRWLRPLFTVLGLGPRWSAVEVDDTTVSVRMSWGFRARIARTAIVRAEPVTERVWAWGAHGWRGRWLVNGASTGLVRLDLDPRQRGHSLGFPLRLRELVVSLEDPAGFLAVVRPG